MQGSVPDAGMIHTAQEEVPCTPGPGKVFLFLGLLVGSKKPEYVLACVENNGSIPISIVNTLHAATIRQLNFAQPVGEMDGQVRISAIFGVLSIVKESWNNVAGCFGKGLKPSAR